MYFYRLFRWWFIERISRYIYIYSLNVNESNICFSFFLYIDSQSNDIEDENNVPTDQTQKTNDNEEDTFLEKFQQQQRKREKLETKEKISHQVFCPFYPEVIQIWFPFFFSKFLFFI